MSVGVEKMKIGKREWYSNDHSKERDREDEGKKETKKKGLGPSPAVEPYLVVTAC